MSLQLSVTLSEAEQARAREAERLGAAGTAGVANARLDPGCDGRRPKHRDGFQPAGRPGIRPPQSADRRSRAPCRRTHPGAGVVVRGGLRRWFLPIVLSILVGGYLVAARVS